MESKINIAELLKDCPSGMELDCTMYEDVYFDYVDELNIIHCYIQRETYKTSLTFNQYGTPNSDIKSKCGIFPKGKTTWEGFIPPCKFKDGDVITCSNCVCTFTSIFKDKPIEKSFQHYCSVILYDNKFIAGVKYADYANPRFATEEEQQKLFQAIKDNGYKWNAETKTLEKLLKFKVGDRVKHISAYTSGIVVKVDDKGYHIDYPKGEGVCYINFTLEKDYELAPNKFDITTLIPFESKVLVRNCNSDYWKPAIFGFTGKDKNAQFCVEGGNFFNKCIPYEGNEHLLGTRKDCDEYYKTWK